MKKAICTCNGNFLKLCLRLLLSSKSSETCVSHVNFEYKYKCLPCVCLSSPEWNTVSTEEQERLGRVRREDGEFWWVCSATVSLKVSLCHTSLLTLTFNVHLLQTQNKKHCYVSLNRRNRNQTYPWHYFVSHTHCLICKKKVRKEKKQAVTDDNAKLHQHSSCNAVQ